MERREENKMKTLKAKIIVASIAMWFGCAAAAHAQSKGTIAVCPAEFDHGSRTSRMTAMKAIEHMLQREGYTVILPPESATAPASQDGLMRYGNQLNAQYVLKPSISFHSRSIWVDLGPRTNSTADVDVTITDVATGRVVYNRDAKARSDEKFNVAKAAGDVVFTPLITSVSGGPKTPHEERAAQIAVYKALDGWTAG
jgi:hypothetical protein